MTSLQDIYDGLQVIKEEFSTALRMNLVSGKTTIRHLAYVLDLHPNQVLSLVAGDSEDFSSVQYEEFARIVYKELFGKEFNEDDFTI